MKQPALSQAPWTNALVGDSLAVMGGISELMAVLFTDLVGSTDALASLGDLAADDIRAQHDRALRGVISLAGGNEVKHLGDGVMVSFESVSDALDCAAGMQEAIAVPGAISGPRLGLRVGVAAGEVTHEGEDIFGRPVVEAARLCALAEPDTVLLTDLARVLAGSRSHHQLTELGPRKLKGFPDPVTVWRLQSGHQVGELLPVGRSRELAAIDAFLAGVRKEQAESMLLRGSPGIGKTCLLEHAARLAAGGGFTVLRTRGAESESELAFAGISDLLRPVLGLLDSLPEPQAQALRGALRLTDSVAEPFAVAAATLGVLAAASEECPLLLVVDDAHWLDRPSLQALLFCARRLDADPVGILFAVRDDATAAFGRDGMAELVVSGLAASGAEALLERSWGRPTDAGVAETLCHATGGNPLALVELTRELSEGQLCGSEPLPDPLPSVSGIDAAFRRRVADLDPELSTALLVVAADQQGSLAAVAAACRELGVDPVVLEAAEATGLARVRGDRIEFDHPLLRSAVYHGADPDERRRAHRALAGATQGDGRAWHLATATLVPNEDIAAQLDEAAADVRRRGGLSTAARLLERAAQLSPEPEGKARRLLGAADSYWLGGAPGRVPAMTDAALECTTDPLLRARIEIIAGQHELWGNGPARGMRRLLRAAEAPGVDPEAMAHLLTYATTAALLTGNVSEASSIGRRAAEISERAGGLAAIPGVFASGFADLLHGDGSVAEARLSPLLQLAETAESMGMPEVEHFVQLAAYVMVITEQYGRAERLLQGTLDRSRAMNESGVAPWLLALASDLHQRTGAWTRSYLDTGLPNVLGDPALPSTSAYGHAFRAQIEANRGRDDRCQLHADEALRLAETYDVGSTRLWTYAALGQLHLGAGRLDDALLWLRKLDTFVTAGGLAEPGMVWWRGDYVEACIRAGLKDEAAGALAVLESEALASGRKWAQCALLRGRGMLADADDYMPYFEESLDVGEELGSPPEIARTRLCLAERLRQSNQRATAREHLRLAVDVFDGLGADYWLDRARRELQATGETVVPLQRGSDELTAQELRVAQVVAAGASNKEAAAELYLSPKTVESHLGSIYRKLGLRSRSQLVANFGKAGAA